MRDDTNRMPNTCPNCGREIDRREQFCAECGAFLWEGQGAPAETRVSPQGAPQRSDEQRAAVQLQLKSELIKVAPGSAESGAFSVKNLGTQVEEFRMLVTGPDWLTVEPATMSVYPGQEGTGTIQAAPPRVPSTTAGAAPFQLTVTSAVHAQVSGSASGRVDVAPFYELAAELAPSSTTGRGTTRYQLRLDNRGNAPVTIPLRTADVADGLRLGVPAYADTGPGQVTEVPIQVYAVRRWFGQPESKTFAIIADAPKPLAAPRLSGTRVAVPLFAAWVPKAALAAGAVAVAAVVAVVALAKSHSTPPTATPGGSPNAASSGSPNAASSGSPTATPSPAPTPYDLLQNASSATWQSIVTSPTSTTSTPMGEAATCQQSFGVVTPTQGYAENLTGATLTDSSAVTGALETDPPASANAEIVGAFALTSPTVQAETFSANIGFCQGGAPDTQMHYQVMADTTAAAPGTLPSGTQVTSGTLPSTSGALQPVTGSIPIGTQTVELVVTNTSIPPSSSPPSTASVVWVNPLISPNSQS
jgi:hypothetical protein